MDFALIRSHLIRFGIQLLGSHVVWIPLRLISIPWSHETHVAICSISLVHSDLSRLGFHYLRTRISFRLEQGWMKLNLSVSQLDVARHNFLFFFFGFPLSHMGEGLYGLL